MLRIQLFTVAFLLAVGLGTATAQSIHEQVQEHVEESLEEEKAEANKPDKPDNPKDDKPKPESDKPKPDKPKPDKPKPDKPSGGVTYTWSSDDPEKPEDKPTGPKLPRRIFHKYFKVDLYGGVGYRGWTPQQYPGVKVDMGHYFTWSVGAKARIFKWICLNKGYFESNYNVSSPRTPYIAPAVKYGAPALKAAWFLGEIGVPIMKAWEPVLRYEARSFTTTASPKVPVAVVPFNQNTDGGIREYRMDDLNVVSGFESAMVGVRYHPSKMPSPVVEHKSPKKPPILLGVAYLSYLKPYQVTINEHVLDNFLFTSRFYGGGIAGGTTFGGGINKPYFDIWAQVGLGRVQLARDLSLNEIAPDNWRIGYVQGNAKLSYRWCPFKFAPSILFVPAGTVSGASFFFFETHVEDGEETTTPTVNWDVLYTARITMIITF